MLDRELARRVVRQEDLPTLPVIMTRILEVVEDEGASATDLTEILDRDPPISAHVLRLANSAFYGLRHKVDSIRGAVVVVGFEAVRMLALATSVFDTLSEREQFALDPGDFWLHSLGAAKAAQFMADRCPRVRAGASCFTAGLLHDMGKYVLALALGARYRSLVEEAAGRETDLCRVEEKALGATSAEVGGWVAERWRLPPVLRQPIAWQNRPGACRGEHAREAAIVSAASDLARLAGFGDAGDCRPLREDKVNPPDGVTATRAEVMAELETYRGDAMAFLEVLGRP